MKLHTKTTLSVLVILLDCATVNAQQLFRLGEVPDTDPAFNNPAFPALTAEELADPPLGEFRKRHLREVNRLRTAIATSLAAAPPGEAGQGSSLFAKFQTWKTVMDQAAASRNQRDVLDLFPLMQELSDARSTPTCPVFFYEPIEIMREFGYSMIQIIAEHIAEKNASVATADLTRFLNFFSKRSFISPTAWEDETLPIDSPGIMILDAPAVVSYLTTKPWKEAAEFLGEATAVEAFARYAATGDGMTALKTKYAANQATIIAKWNELAAWVASQRPPH